MVAICTKKHIFLFSILKDFVIRIIYYLVKRAINLFPVLKDLVLGNSAVNVKSCADCVVPGPALYVIGRNARIAEELYS